MKKNGLLKIASVALRVLLFFPICILVMSLINIALAYLFIWLLTLSKFWFILVVIFFGGAIWGIFNLLASMLVALTSYISPIGWLSFSTISILAVANCIRLCYVLWTLDNSVFGIFGSLVVTLLVLELTWSLISGALAAINKE